MSVLLFVLIISSGIIVPLLARLAQRRRPLPGLTLREVGLVVDQSLRLYQRLWPPLIALSLLLLPLGFGSGGTALLWSQLLGFGGFGSPLGAASWLSVLGLGKTFLAYGVARALLLHSAGRPVTLGTLLRDIRWRPLLALAALLAVPSAISVGLSVLGVVLAVSWSLAPAVLAVEDTGPAAAMRRAIGLAREHFGALIQTLAALWAIGSLIVVTPLVAVRLLLLATLDLPPETVGRITALVFALGASVVAPLAAIGAYELYRYVSEREREHEQPLVARIAAWERADV